MNKSIGTNLLLSERVPDLKNSNSKIASTKLQVFQTTVRNFMNTFLNQVESLEWLFSNSYIMIFHME